MNGRKKTDIEGNFTYIGVNGKSVVDYLLSPYCLFECIDEFNVTLRTESDHLPLCWKLKCTLQNEIVTNRLQSGSIEKCKRYMWKKEYCDQFQNNICLGAVHKEDKPKDDE